MEIIAKTWNVGGGHVLLPGANPAELASFTDEGLDSFVETLKSEPADIVALQEVHSNDTFNQAKEIAAQLGYSFVDCVLSPSHVGTGYNAGLALLTPHKIIDPRHGLFTNPEIETKWEWGEVQKSHNKGYLSCLIDIGGKLVEVTTFHLFPFRRLGLGVELTSPEAQAVLRDI
ncbi:MAG: endonuclease/exonuclease/phosphatase family protein [Candidatus Saccharimonadales bacterium]